MIIIKCDGDCGSWWFPSEVGAVNGPALQVLRVNGLGGGGMTDKDMHFCSGCGPTAVVTSKLKNTSQTRPRT